MIWKVDNLLSHFDGSYHYPNFRFGRSESFEWVGRLISANRIFPAVSEKRAFACKKAPANVFLHIYLE